MDIITNPNQKVSLQNEVEKLDQNPFWKPKKRVTSGLILPEQFWSSRRPSTREERVEKGVWKSYDWLDFWILILADWKFEIRPNKQKIIVGTLIILSKYGRPEKWSIREGEMFVFDDARIADKDVLTLIKEYLKTPNSGAPVFSLYREFPSALQKNKSKIENMTLTEQNEAKKGQPVLAQHLTKNEAYYLEDWAEEKSEYAEGIEPYFELDVDSKVVKYLGPRNAKEEELYHQKWSRLIREYNSAAGRSNP